MEQNTGFKIIVIDDNPAIHEDFIKILTTKTASDFDKVSSNLFGDTKEEVSLPRFEISTAAQGQDGFKMVEEAYKADNPFSLAFVDIRMPPGWDGIETVKQLWKVDNDLQVVICTAYSDYSWEETVENLGKTDNLLILKKPFDHIAVRQLACAMTRKWELLQNSRNYTSTLEERVEDRTLSLEKSLSLVQATLDSSNDGIVAIDTDGKIVTYNKKFCDMWKLPNNEIEEMDEIKFIDYAKNILIDASDFENKLHHSNASQMPTFIQDIKFKDGAILECHSQQQMLNDKTFGRVLSFHDVTKRARLEERLEFQAMHDALTGLPNRIMLTNKLKQAIDASSQNSTMTILMFLDLDRFKLINDSLSHSAGDEVLKEAAKRLHSIMRIEDTLSRFGGDEFVIIFPNIASHENITALAKKVKEVFKEPFLVAGREIIMSASIGISYFPNAGNNINTLLSNADAAMYHAKEMGGNDYQIYSEEMNLLSLEKLDKETQLRQALLNHEFFLCYQPEFDVTSDKIVATEALIRWNQPGKGVALPMDFIPLAEKTGLIVEIGEWALRTACMQNKAWQDAGLPPIRVAVNVVTQQLRQKSFVSMIKNILDETGLEPQYLEIELTENIIISSIENMATISELKKLGIHIAVDDFGTGYSSLNYLNKVPLDRLKIDSSFIQNIKAKGDDDVIIRAIIGMANNLKLEVLAEGVETQHQLDFLKDNLCSEVQGYFYSKPLSTEELTKFLKDPKSLKLVKSK